MKAISQRRSSSRSVACLISGFILMGVLILSTIVITFFVRSQAIHTFGEPSSELGTFQRLYLSALILIQANDLTQPANPNGVEVNLTISSGESVPSIIGKLWEAGLITNPGVFRSYLQYTGMDVSLKAGDYNLSPKMTAIEIAQAIQSSTSAEITLPILPGWRAEEIANSLQSSGFTISIDEFLQAVHSHPEGYTFSSCLPEDSIEGFLFPGSYIVPRQTTLGELLSMILMNFDTQVSPEMRNGFQTQGLNLCQAVTLASLVQREAVQEDEMPLIASVFYNRLNAGAVLASDPTVQYALGFNPNQATWWTNPLSAEDLQVDSPYNTYLHQGLPPGPIANPGLEALRAVAFPAQTQYYYFRAACDGSGRHLFAETYQEHLANACP